MKKGEEPRELAPVNPNVPTNWKLDKEEPGDINRNIPGYIHLNQAKYLDAYFRRSDYDPDEHINKAQVTSESSYQAED